MTQNQYELDFAPIVNEPESCSLPFRFARFHLSNPQVFDNLVKLAHKFRQARPKAKLGIQMLMEVLRWDYFMQTEGEE